MIKEQFNSSDRINEALLSYGSVDAPKENVDFDPYEKLRENLIFDLVNENASKSKKILDVGTGLGTLVEKLALHGHSCEGIDLADKPIEIGKQRLQSKGIDPSILKVADFLDWQPKNEFDLIVANGVIWYYENKEQFLKKCFECLAPGGKTIIVHRNDLFNMYALNKGTLDFFEKHFLSWGDDSFRADTRKKIERENTGLEDPVIKHTSSRLQKPYDNPLNISEIYKANGFDVKGIFYVYIHPTIPKLKLNFDSEVYTEVQKRFSSSWQGMFMGSQFVVLAEKL